MSFAPDSCSLLSAILYGLRVSLEIGLSSVFISVALGVSLGLISGYAGGVTDAVIMRFCDVMLSFPAILLALLIDGIIRVILPESMHDQAAYGFLSLQSLFPAGCVMPVRSEVRR